MKKYICSYIVILFIILGFTGCGQPSIISGSHHGNLDKVKAEVRNGVDINTKNAFGITPLYMASFHGKLPVVKYLVQNGADVNLQKNTGDTPLHAASWSGNLEILKYLIKKDADITIKNNFGNTPLHTASWQGKFEVVKYLINSGADITLKNNFGNTPLYNAMQTNRLEIVRYLMNHLDKDKVYLLRASQWDNLEIVKFFVQRGYDVNHTDADKSTALHYTVYFGKDDINIIRHLVENGADISKVNVHGDTPLSLAKKHKKLKMIQYLENIDKKNLVVQKKKAKKEKKKKELSDKKKIHTYILKKDFDGLKTYTDKNPNAVYYIKDSSLRLLLTGPKGMKVGDIKRLIKEGEDESIIISLVKRVKTPYKEYTIKEIKLLKKLGIKSKIISAMIDRTTYLLENTEKRKEQEYYLAEQKRIKDTNVKEKIVYTNQKTDKEGNPLIDKVQDKLIEQGAKMLFDKLF